MKIALLMGNRFNTWHLQPFARMKDVEITCFRAESEIQKYFADRDDGSATFNMERIYFDTQTGPLPQRMWNTLQTRHRNREPRVVPFWERLEGFDIIQTWELFTDWSEQAAIARDRFGSRCSVMVWDNIPFNMERTPYRRAIKERVISSGDVFLVYSERSRQTLLFEGVNPARIELVNPGVDVERFCPGPGDRAALGVPEDAFLILFVGWFLPRKGLDFLLFALAELLRTHATAQANPHLVMVGSGPGRDRIEGIARRLGIEQNCHFTGSLPYDKMPNAFRCSDAFVLPSIATPEWQEQFGMSIIEAMACGAPVITTWSGAIPEIVGDAGVLCQPNDFVALRETLGELIEDVSKRAVLGNAGRQRVLARYDVRQQAATLEGIYRQIAANL